MSTSVEKQKSIQLFTNATKSMIKSDIQSKFLEVFELYNRNFLELFQDKAVISNKTLVHEILSILQKVDDLSLSFLHSPQFIELITLLSSISPPPTAQSHSNQSSSPILQVFEIINKIEDLLTIPNLSTSSSHFTTLLNLIISQVPSNELALSELSCILTERYLSISPSHVSQLKTYSETYRNNSVIYLRYCAIVAKLISKNDNLFDYCLSNGCIDMIWTCCKNNDDILTQIVAIEYLRHFADTQAGLKYLFSSDIFSWLVTVSYEYFHDEDEIIRDNHHNKNKQLLPPPPQQQQQVTMVKHDPVLVSQCLREISEIFSCASKNHLFDQSVWSAITDENILHQFLQSALSHIGGAAEETRLTGLKVLTDFACSSDRALYLIVEDDTILKAWSNVCNSSKNDLQSAALHSYARVLEHDYRHIVAINQSGDDSKSSSSSSSTSSSTTIDKISSSSSSSSNAMSVDDLGNFNVDLLKKRIWQCIGEAKNTPTLTYLLRMTHQPISNLRHAALDILQALLKSDVVSEIPNNSRGLQQLCLSPEFREYLVNIETESTKEGREWKFALIQAVARHPQLNSLTQLVGGLTLPSPSTVPTGSSSTDWVSEVKRVEARGPHYKAPQMNEMATMEH